MERPTSTEDPLDSASKPSASLTSTHAPWIHRIASLIPENASHPAQVAIRTYSLSLSLSLVPSLVPFVTSRSEKHSKHALKRVLAREFGLGGFAFSITLALGGGSLIRELWRALDDLSSGAPASTVPDGPESPATAVALKLRAWISVLKLSSAQKTFLSNVISSSAGLLLLQAGRSRSHNRASSSKEPSASRTLDLTLLLLVRALDAAVQSFVARKSGGRRKSDASLPGQRSKTAIELTSSLKREMMRTQIDSLVFWACSARCVAFSSI